MLPAIAAIPPAFKTSVATIAALSGALAAELTTAPGIPWIGALAGLVGAVPFMFIWARFITRAQLAQIASLQKELEAERRATAWLRQELRDES